MEDDVLTAALVDLLSFVVLGMLAHIIDDLLQILCHTGFDSVFVAMVLEICEVVIAEESAVTAYPFQVPFFGQGLFETLEELEEFIVAVVRAFFQD